MKQARDKHNAKQKCRDHNRTDTRQDHSIEAIKIQAGSNSKPGSHKFVSFSLLIGKFSHFTWLTTALLMKVDVVVDKKKKSQKLSTHLIEATEILVGNDSKPRSPKFISFSSWIDKFSHFKLLTTTLLMKVNIVVDGKKKSRKSSTY